MYLKFKLEEIQRNRGHEENKAARACKHEIRMTEIYLSAMTVNANQGNHFPTNMHSITTPIRYNTIADTNFSRPFAEPYPTASISYLIQYEIHKNEVSVSNSYLENHGFDSPN